MHSGLLSTSRFRSTQRNSQTREHTDLTVAFAHMVERLGQAVSSLSRAYGITGLLYGRNSAATPPPETDEYDVRDDQLRTCVNIALAQTHGQVSDAISWLRAQAITYDLADASDRAAAATATNGLPAGRASDPAQSPAAAPTTRSERRR